MLCSDCLPVNPVAACSDSIIIGTLAANTDYIVYWQLTQPKKIIAFEVTSDNTGLLTVSPAGRLRAEKTYLVWATLATAKSMTEKEEITIDSEITCCVEVHTNSLEATEQQFTALTNCTI